MSRRLNVPMAAIVGSVLLLPFPASAQTPAPEQARQTSKSAKQEESKDYYSKWLNQDVGYIIDAEERAVFLKLSTDEERDSFIEQFWLRRDPDPRTAENEVKTEHYRRISYANERFHAGIPGWRTDRGRIYIMYGPPDRLESHPNGGRYERKLHEGGGTTQVYPFEVWEYRYIEGVGSEIELEFVGLGARTSCPHVAALLLTRVRSPLRPLTACAGNR